MGEGGGEERQSTKNERRHARNAQAVRVHYLENASDSFTPVKEITTEKPM